MKSLLQADELAQITSAIDQAEAKTSADIVPMVVNLSDRYEVVNYRGGVFVGIILLASHGFFFPNSWSILHEGSTLFAIGMVIGYLACFLTPVRRIFLMSKEKNEEVHQKALESFHQMNLPLSPARNGVLIFISLLEKKVEILADVNWQSQAKITKENWQQLSDELAKNIREGSLSLALTQTIKKIGDMAQTHFPQEKQTKRSNHFENTLRTDKDLTDKDQ